MFQTFARVYKSFFTIVTDTGRADTNSTSDTGYDSITVGLHLHHGLVLTFVNRIRFNYLSILAWIALAATT